MGECGDVLLFGFVSDCGDAIPGPGVMMLVLSL